MIEPTMPTPDEAVTPIETERRLAGVLGPGTAVLIILALAVACYVLYLARRPEERFVVVDPADDSEQAGVETVGHANGARP